MKNTWHILRLLAIVLYMLSAVLGSVVAQEENADPLLDNPQTNDTGTPGVVDTTNNLNLPIVPPPPDNSTGQNQGNQPPILPNTPTGPVNVLANFGSMVSTSEVVARTVSALFKMPMTASRKSSGDSALNAPAVVPKDALVYRYGYHRDFKRLYLADHQQGQGMDAMTQTKLPLSAEATKRLRRQSLEVVYSYTDPTNGVTVNVFSDATFVAEDEDGTTLLTGYFAFVGDDMMVAIAQDLDGTRYAFYEAYYSAYTADGDVLIGNLFTQYTYDYDEDGNLVSLTDSDGGEYQVEVDDSGTISITGPDGYTVLVDDNGDFELYDEAGELVAEGNLTDGINDEFEDFEASSDDEDASDEEDSGDDEGSNDGGATGDGGGGDDSSIDDSSGDDGGSADDSSTGDAGGDDSGAGDAGGGGDDSSAGDAGGDG